jgi:SAM-dependent methyltransferase
MTHNRDAAYGLRTPADHARYYDAWSATYDEDFAAASGYLPPGEVARTFRELAGPNDSPVADIGCGTGLVGTALALPAVDGFDISTGMLAAAARTGRYRNLIAADLTEPGLPVAAAYGGIVSSGTFTRGHLGPRELGLVLRLARPGALCVIAINAEHFIETGFSREFERLQTTGTIDPATRRDMRSYAAHGVADVRVNHTTVAVFRMTG